ncbi:MAG: YceD family protein [Bacteroidales bacterium]|nr:YceD family protein [Bacteroidales bacterium]
MDNCFIIPLNSLAQGHTEFTWSVGKEFFQEFGNTEIIDANLTATADAEKSGQYLGIDCTITGYITVPCDRCLGDLECPIDVTVRLSIKYGTPSEDMNDGEREVICLPAHDTDLDMSQTIYDYACLSLPIQRVHADGECDEEIISRLGIQQPAGSLQASEENNPFASLKGIFEN